MLGPKLFKKLKLKRKSANPREKVSPATSIQRARPTVACAVLVREVDPAAASFLRRGVVRMKK